MLAPTRELALQVAEAFSRYGAKLPRRQRAADLRRPVLRRAAGRAAPRRAGRRRHAGPRHRPPRARHARPVAASTTWCSTRPTRCCRWASPRTSSASSPTPPSTSRSRCSRRPCRAAIRKITTKYLHDAVEVTVKSKTATAENITQRYIQVAGPRKMDALTRVLEVEPFEAMIVFVRTKQATEEVAETAAARGFSAAAINGDIPQAQRERTIAQLKDGDDRHPGRHRRRGPRPRRRAHLARAELRHPARHRVLRAPHRPHRPGRPVGHGAAVRLAARAPPAQVDRAGHPAEAHRGAAAERRRRQRPAGREVPGLDHRRARRPGFRDVPPDDRGLRARATTCRWSTSPPRWPRSPATARTS